MKKTVFLFVCTFLFALNIREVNNNTPFEKLDFSDSLYEVPSDYMPYVFKHKKIKIVGIEGREKGIILTHKKRLKEIKTIANANLASKIVLNSVNGDYKIVNANVDDFLNNKVDAIYLPYGTFKTDKNIYVFHLDRFIYFPKKIILGEERYLNRYKNELYIFKKNYNILFNGLILSKYFFNDKSPISDSVYFKIPKSRLVKVYVTPNWAPFDIYNNGKLSGIGIEFWKLIAKKARIDYIFIKDYCWSDILEKIKKKEADVTPNTTKTKDREKFAYFSKTYVSFPLGIVCKSHQYFNGIDDIKTIAVGRNYSAEKLMKRYYPNIKYIEANNTLDAIFFVENSKAQCVADILPSLMWYIHKSGIHDMVLEFKTRFKFNLKVMVNKNDKELLSKINHAIDEITPEEKHNIISKYSSVILVEKNIKNVNRWIVLFFLTVIVTIMVILLRFKKRSEIDEMTKILNRHTIEKKLKTILHKTDGGVLFLDIDRFKNINDTYGHEFGDYVIKEFSKIIKQNIRSTDLFGRWGGEEFVIILPKTKFTDAMKIAEKIRKSIESADFDSKKITVSIGVTEYKKGEYFENVVRRADEAVYEAKRRGRNKVVGKRINFKG